MNLNNLLQSVKKSFRKHARKVAGVAAAGSAMVTSAAMAAGPDVTAAVTAISDSVATVVTVGGACLIVVVTVKTFSFVRSAIK